MKFKKKNIGYFVLILSAYLFICLLKTDRNILPFQDYDNTPHRTYTELLTEPYSPDFHSITNRTESYNTEGFSKFAKLKKGIYCRNEFYRSEIPLRFVLFVTRIFNKNNVILSQSSKIISIQQKKSIHHKSSDDDAFLA
ncbi:MAG TPA: hypothetical protein VN514_00375 [Ignavibacteria bacterium]|nr:hypothetical protein [Ignavibacteria bacterium]